MQGCKDCFIPQFPADAKEHVLEMLSKKALFESHCLFWMFILMAVIGQKPCCGLHVKCGSLGLRGVNTRGVHGVRCEFSRSLHDNETVVWMFGNCTWIGNCTSKECTSLFGGYQPIIQNVKYFLYPNQIKRDAQFLLSVCDESLNLVSQSNITAAVSSNVSENYSSPSTLACSCVDYAATTTVRYGDKAPDDNLDKEPNLKFAMTNETLFHYNKSLHASIFSSTILTSHGDQSGLNSPRTLPIIILLAVVIPVSALALMSSICACCVGCRVNKRVPILPQAISFHQTTSNDMNSGINLTSVTLHSQITPSHLVSSAHSLVDNSKVGEEETHIYETPDACLVGEKPPSLWKDNGPILFSSNDEHWRTDSGVQNYEKVQLEPEVYNKLKRIQLAPMAEAGGSARDLYNKFEERDSSKNFYHTLECNLADSAKQNSCNSL